MTLDANELTSGPESFQEKLDRSSIGHAQREIEELGLDHHLLHLEQEMAPKWARKPCPECGREA